MTNIAAKDFGYDPRTREDTTYLFIDVALNGGNIGYHGYPIGDLRYRAMVNKQMGGRHLTVTYDEGEDQTQQMMLK